MVLTTIFRYNEEKSMRKKLFVLFYILLLHQFAIPLTAEDAANILDKTSPITIDFRDTDVRDVLRTIADICSVNIVSASNVKGNITISLKEVHLKDALEAILTVNKYAWKIKGAIIYVEGRQTLKTHFVQLKYADGTEMQQILDPLKSSEGIVIVDTRSNKLIIKDYENYILEIKRIIEELDIPTPQVTINAKIIDLEIKDALELGLYFTSTRKAGDPEGESRERSSGFTLRDAEEEEGRIQGYNTDYNTQKARSNQYEANFRESDSTSNGTFGYNYTDHQNVTTTVEHVTAMGSYTTAVVSAALSDILNVKLDALITKDNNILLASPTITTLNNQTASIIIGEKIGIKEQTQTTTGTTETIRFQDVGTKLEVTPQINVDGYITMDIKPEISSVSIYTEETVRFKTSEARTKIRVKDGQTVIIGGLVKNEETLGRRRVPFISRIPIIGIPFRAKYDTGIQSELVVFLTPKILKVENMENRLSIQAQELQRSNEAKAKEEEMTEKFGNGYEWHKKPPTNINEDKSRAKKFFKEALKLDRKARRLKGERSEKIYKISINVKPDLFFINKSSPDLIFC